MTYDIHIYIYIYISKSIINIGLQGVLKHYKMFLFYGGLCVNFDIIDEITVTHYSAQEEAYPVTCAVNAVRVCNVFLTSSSLI